MGFGVIFETVCGKDAASEPPGMGSRRVEKGHAGAHAGGHFKLAINQQYQSTQHQKSASRKAQYWHLHRAHRRQGCAVHTNAIWNLLASIAEPQSNRRL